MSNKYSAKFVSLQVWKLHALVDAGVRVRMSPSQDLHAPGLSRDTLLSAGELSGNCCLFLQALQVRI